MMGGAKRMKIARKRRIGLKDFNPKNARISKTTFE